MKTHIVLFLTFILYVFLLVNCQTSTRKIDNYKSGSVTIYLDPGHGGFDGGTTYLGVMEKDITLVITNKVALLLTKTGYNVKLTRKVDTSLGKTKKKDIYERVDLINESSAFAYLSIHVNSFPSPVVWGAQTFYTDANENNIVIAECIQKMFKMQNPENKRVAKKITGKYLLDNVKTAGCLVELGFLTNENDRINLTNDEYQNQISLMIYLGLLDYIETLGVS